MSLKSLIVTSLLASGLIPLASAQQSASFTATEGKITRIGSTAIPAASPFEAAAPLSQPNVALHRTAPKPDLRTALRRSIRPGFASTLQALSNPNPAPLSVVGPNPSFHGFPGFTSLDSAIVNNFVTEPPDQGLAVGNGFVFEAINDVFGIYDTTGFLVAGPISANQFFRLPPTVQKGKFVGPSVSDPRAYFDHDIQRWFVTAVEYGLPNGRTYLLLAVSVSSDPFSSFHLYSIDATNDGNHGTPAHPGCPCIPDQPLIGADRYGFYISANEFGTGFNGAEIYALSKDILAFGGLPTLEIFSGLPLAEAVAYSVQPANSVSFTSEPFTGVEYFLSALDFTGTLDNRIAVWAMLDTSSLIDFHPHPTLTHKIITSQVYGQPPPAIQNPGLYPLGMSLDDPPEYLETNDDRMNQVVFENGKLWSGVNTVVGGVGGQARRAGIAYFIVTPNVTGSVLSASFTKNGYVSAPGLDSVIFPAIGATPSGRAAMVFTLVGPTPTPAFIFTNVFYPSMAFSTISSRSGPGVIQLGAAGFAPEDGFSGYKQFGGNGVARWGDYSAAVADTDNSIWMATEWIPDSPRTKLTNWGTFIGQLQ